ncbi:hypothetical protein BKG95_06740 [Rodentibacter pneumotropicus]|uniref:LysM peptidoglycan-binding domain-containing protein n=1 Tax=Rodentibacter pneumotropicus TaxID=758 RepID=UPI0009898076|nr:LysM peptidoglycan-binding domain-containing protein [Rodentibacter pneumotropicus]OOF67689.1 hypothetical protein BKG95_06740 [Rodentibacter pneumotropicus]
MAKQELYRIEFFDNERNAMPYCYFELYMNGHLVTGLPPKADSQGKIWINKQWVESTPSSPKELVVRFWNSEFPKTQHSETEKFIWPKGKTSIKAFLPAVYTINTRPLANENNEEQNYQRAYYLVRKGDSWEKLEVELGVNTVEALMFHNQINYSDYLAEGMKLYYPLGFRTRNMVDSEVSDKKIEQKQSKKPEKIDKKEQKQDGEKKENTIEQRSQANGKPVEVAPKKDGCFCYRDFTVEDVKSIVSSLSGSKSYKLFTHSKCPLEEKEKSYEKLTEELNNTFKKYEINTCIRKIHFLTQIYLESAHLTTTVEFASGSGYDPGKHPSAIENQNTKVGDGPRYKGRGLMQLTWRKNYLSYFKYTRLAPENYKTIISPTTKFEDMVNRKNNFHSLIGEKLFLAVDSAGWYWRYGSVWGDLNIPADNDDIYIINIGINGGFNDFGTRIKWAKKIIKDNNIENCPNINLSKELGKYNFLTSNMRNKDYGKKRKSKFESYDD